ncbi:MAG TPA: bifunctional phosphoribosyl-AMP cyclohydrolase/phosphoribosyl-ATP diphosphatase HisIE, partial [Cyclobacteriaceae bacterium]|nr:bifunctional phosphoribosyl-AMP cyclohydrolase/phosphoribosyl-ATP diphosphatase HisIE [Cyclobacteriaceae bacterium]
SKKLVTFYSRSRKQLWTKGESSGNYLHVRDIMEDCDGDTLLITAKPDGPVCHTGSDTCFNEINKDPYAFIRELEEVIADRKTNPREGSYTASLFSGGINRIAQKVGEEAVELVIEAKDNHEEAFLNEAADLFFHYLVLLSAKGVPFAKILSRLEERRK